MSEGVEWGLHCCVTLGWLADEGAVPIRRLAEFFDLPQEYLKKRLQALTRAGVLTSTPGVNGGFSLARAPEHITLMDVVTAMDGPVEPFRCMEIRRRGVAGSTAHGSSPAPAASPRRCAGPLYSYVVPVMSAMGAEASAQAWLLLLYGLGAIVGSLGAGAADRYGALRVLATGYLALTVTLAAMAWAVAADVKQLGVTGALLAAWGASTWFQTPAQQLRLIAAAPQETAVVIGLNASALYLGIAAGTSLGGLLLPHGVLVPVVCCAALAALCLPCLALTYRRSTGRRTAFLNGTAARRSGALSVCPVRLSSLVRPCGRCGPCDPSGLSGPFGPGRLPGVSHRG